MSQLPPPEIDPAGRGRSRTGRRGRRAYEWPPAERPAPRIGRLRLESAGKTAPPISAGRPVRRPAAPAAAGCGVAWCCGAAIKFEVWSLPAAKIGDLLEKISSLRRSLGTASAWPTALPFRASSASGREGAQRTSRLWAAGGPTLQKPPIGRQPFNFAGAGLLRSAPSRRK